MDTITDQLKNIPMLCSLPEELAILAREDSLNKQMEIPTLPVGETTCNEQFSDLTQAEFFTRHREDAERIRRENSGG